jgi:hypothetical protein
MGPNPKKHNKLRNTLHTQQQTTKPNFGFGTILINYLFYLLVEVLRLKLNKQRPILKFALFFFLSTIACSLSQ